MACDYCDGNSKELPLDEWATDIEFDACARLEGVDEDNSVIWVQADGANVYVFANFCPRCGRKLGEGSE